MPQAVEVRRVHDWAIPPFKRRVDRGSALDEACLLAAHFRFQRQFRRAEACPPWVMGQELGWIVASPVTVDLAPLDDVQVAAADEAEMREAGRLLGRDEFWRRGKGCIVVGRNDWLRSFQYRGIDGRWEGMFLPNGQGSVEWRLGWSIRVPSGYFLLVTSLDNGPAVSVPTGILTDREVNRTWDGGVFSLAIRPTQAVTLTRGQPVARIVLLSRDSLQARIHGTQTPDAEAEDGL